jgi:transcriptional regulator with XRE-family HTH domain
VSPDVPETFDVRLDLALAKKGLNDAGLAGKIGVSRAYVSEVRKDRKDNNGRGEEVVRKMATELEVDPDWLTTGVNPPRWYLPGASGTPEQPTLAIILGRLDQLTKAIERLNQMRPEGHEAALADAADRLGV